MIVVRVNSVVNEISCAHPLVCDSETCKHTRNRLFKFGIRLIQKSHARTYGFLFSRGEESRNTDFLVSPQRGMSDLLRGLKTVFRGIFFIPK